jgi:hypothetical protein
MGPSAETAQKEDLGPEQPSIPYFFGCTSDPALIGNQVTVIIIPFLRDLGQPF